MYSRMSRFTKLIILFPHVAGACSACHDLREKQVYNSVDILSIAWIMFDSLKIVVLW